MDGVVVIDKPKGLTSHTVVQKVKRIYGAKKAGHTGTLDPLATGVLPVCLGKATKLAGMLMEGVKEYEVTILLGTKTDTYDIEGNVLATEEVPDGISEKVNEILPEFRGEIEQKPPYFSAVKYKGKPLYKWAREGRFIDVDSRKVEIKRFDIEHNNGKIIKARIVCSKGTYVRSLCHDLGVKLGVGACMFELRRISTGRFHIENSVTFDQLHSFTPEQRLEKKVFTKIDLLC